MTTVHKITNISSNLLRDPFALHNIQSLLFQVTDELTFESELEQESNIVELCFVLLLSRYPLLPKYWTSYAKLCFRNGSKSKALESFKLGLSVLQFDVEMWTSYLNYRVEHISDDLEDVLKEFKRGMRRIGNLFYANQFFEMYINFFMSYFWEVEDTNEELLSVLMLAGSKPKYAFSTLFKRVEDICIALKEKNKLKTLPSTSLLYEHQSLLASKVFEFERQLNAPLIGKPEQPNDIKIWQSYINFVCVAFDDEYIMQFLERSLLATGYDNVIVKTCCAFCISRQRINKARSILKRALHANNYPSAAHILIQLTLLEIYLGNFRRARDYLAQFARLNKSLPDEVLKELLSVNAFFTS